MSLQLKSSDPKYSICMCNYNMADTLEPALTSIIDQLDDQYEIVIADDGSSDNSVTVIKKLQEKYKNLRLIPLRRDRKRKLGFTRNICISEARGEYIFLNIDCDDIYEPFIKDFAEVFHQIENCIKKDFYLSGQNINMARKGFLIEHGPYRNIFRGEDRDMWLRFAAIDAYQPLDHTDFVTRLPKNSPKRIKRVLIHTWDDLQNIFRSGATLKRCLKNDTMKFRRGILSWKAYICRVSFMIPAKIAASFKEPIHPPENMNTPEKFKVYREDKAGTFKEIMERNNCKPNFSRLSIGGRKVFNPETIEE